MVLIINPFAGGGRAQKKWQKIERLITDRLNSFEKFFLRHDTDLDVIVKNYLNKGHLHFVSAGGDGSLNILTRSLIENVPEKLLQEINIGAIGLGSSNDFHKPFKDSSMINNIPCKINFSSTTKRDVGMLEYLNKYGKRSKYFWLLNASIGITAEANMFFNQPDLCLKFLKKVNSNAAIIYTVLHTLLCYKNLKMHIHTFNNWARETYITNLSIIKSPHFSGNFCYDTPFNNGNEIFDIHMCENMSLTQVVLTLCRLTKNKFSGYPNTCSFRSPKIEVYSNRPFTVEFDGEVINSVWASFNVKPNYIRLCTC